jgi:hypothetical protein
MPNKNNDPEECHSLQSKGQTASQLLNSKKEFERSVATKVK